MLRRGFLLAAASSAALAWAPSAVRAGGKAHAVFVNPGRHDEDFWSEVSRAARAAAHDLGIELSVVYGERDRLLTVAAGRQAIAAAPPDAYVLIVNEQQCAPELMDAALRRGLRVLMVFNPLVGEDADRFGPPRKLHSNFIGQLIPDNVDGGARIARAVIGSARILQPGAPVSMVALNGLTATPAAADRGFGLRQVVAAERDVDLLQVISVDWTEADGYARCAGLLRRYPGVNAVWCANDPIAAGAMRALVEAGRRPGIDVAVAGLNWSVGAIRAVADGRMAATVGGHVLCAAFALVMVADHARGVDFAVQGTELTMPFGAIDQAAARRWLAHFGGGRPDWKTLDFRQLSRAHTPSVRTYDFSPLILLG